MPKTVSALELTLSSRPPQQTLTDWLYAELRNSILEGRLRPGTRLPASRDFARQHSLSRGTVVVVFERLLAEGYLSSRVGSGTWVSDRGAAGAHARAETQAPPAYVRGVRCSADQVVIVSGVQQALDLLARLLLKPDDPVWVEDPAYVGAVMAFSNAGAKVVPVPVDEQGLSVSAGVRACGRPRGMYLTPAHQFPLGVTMSLERRMEVLKCASRLGAFVIEDDYDSEYRFEGRPVPTLQSLDRSSSVILVGSFSKLLFPSLRLGYVVLPPSLVDYFLAFRLQTDFRSVGLDQAVLCDFIEGGHLGRHLRRMRELYAGRLATLLDGGRRRLKGLLEISNVRAGLYTVGFLKNGMTSRAAEAAAAARGVEAVALDRYTLKRPDPQGVLLGFAAFDEATIREGLVRLAAALSRRNVRAR